MYWTPEKNFMYRNFSRWPKLPLKEFIDRGHIPILTEEQGFYIQAVLYDIDFTEEETGGACRKELEQYAKEHRSPCLHRRLEAVDPNLPAQSTPIT